MVFWEFVRRSCVEFPFHAPLWLVMDFIGGWRHWDDFLRFFHMIHLWLIRKHLRYGKIPWPISVVIGWPRNSHRCYKKNSGVVLTFLLRLHNGFTFTAEKIEDRHSIGFWRAKLERETPELIETWGTACMLVLGFLWFPHMSLWKLDATIVE